MPVKRLAFAYGRTFLFSRLLLLGGLVTLVALTVATTPAFPVVTGAVIAAILVVYGLVFVLSPLLTDHWITRSRLILRQGWYFRAIVPFADIESLAPADEAARTRVPLGIHRPMGHPTLFVTGGRIGLVALRLGRPRRFWQAFGLVASEILFDVTDREGFLAAFEERRGSFTPVEPERAYAELRD